MLCVKNMNDKVTCERHGEAFSTYVCEHLVGAIGVGWYSAVPTEDDPWPSAWCEKCNEAYSAEGEWNERSEKSVNLKAKLICHHCYENFRNQCKVHNV